MCTDSDSKTAGKHLIADWLRMEHTSNTWLQVQTLYT
jgi:hypothetical protein